MQKKSKLLRIIIDDGACNGKLILFITDWLIDWLTEMTAYLQNKLFFLPDFGIFETTYSADDRVLIIFFEIQWKSSNRWLKICLFFSSSQKNKKNNRHAIRWHLLLFELTKIKLFPFSSFLNSFIILFIITVSILWRTTWALEMRSSRKLRPLSFNEKCYIKMWTTRYCARFKIKSI